MVAWSFLSLVFGRHSVQTRGSSKAVVARIFLGLFQRDSVRSVLARHHSPVLSN